jgi:hypothetical protein
MHYSIHQELARARHDDLLREATQARLAALAREGREPVQRFNALRALMQRRKPLHRPAPAI